MTPHLTISEQPVQIVSLENKETSHMLSLRVSLIVCAVGLWAAGAMAEADKTAGDKRAAGNRICTDNKEELAYLLSLPAVREMLKELPESHRVKPQIKYKWSDDERRHYPQLIALTPLGPDGKPDGTERHFGTEERFVPYHRGRKHGTEMAYSLSGGDGKRRLVNETPWKKGKIHGTKKVYHPRNGKLHMEVPCENGRRQGEAKTYDLPGRLVKVTPYKNDKTHGKVIEYFPGTEQEKKVIPFRRGKVHGVVFEYYEDGSLKRELPARDDHFHGIEKAYDEKGQLIRTRYWLDDEIVSKDNYLKATKQK